MRGCMRNYRHRWAEAEKEQEEEQELEVCCHVTLPVFDSTPSQISLDLVPFPMFCPLKLKPTFCYELDLSR